MLDLGHNSKGEGGDFLLEKINRKIKRWMPPGVPNEKRWQRVCRNLDRIEKLTGSVHDLFEADIVDDRRKTILNEEIQHWRVMVRNSELLSKPMEDSAVTDLKGRLLDSELFTFATKCKSNRELYFQNGKQKLEPVFVSPEDRNKYYDIKNKPKAEIICTIQNTITEVESLGGIEESDILRLECKDIKKWTKTVLLSFYKRTIETIEMVSEKEH